MDYANYYVKIGDSVKKRFSTNRSNIDAIINGAAFDFKGRTSYDMSHISREQDFVRVNKKRRTIIFECNTLGSAVKCLKTSTT